MYNVRIPVLGNDQPFLKGRKETPGKSSHDKVAPQALLSSEQGLEKLYEAPSGSRSRAFWLAIGARDAGAGRSRK